MLTLDEIKAALRDRRPGRVAEATGLTRITVMAVRDGKSDNPSYETIRRLSEYLEGSTP